MFEYAFNLMDEGKMIREAVDASDRSRYRNRRFSSKWKVL